MTKTIDAALKLALEALEHHSAPYLHHEAEYQKAITAIKAALAQPEQEPVAYASTAELIVFSTVKDKAMVELWKRRVFDSDIALYTAPPQRPWAEDKLKEKNT